MQIRPRYSLFCAALMLPHVGFGVAHGAQPGAQLGAERGAEPIGAGARIELAQAQPAEDPAAKKRREDEQKRRQQAPPPPPQPPRQQPQVQPKLQPPPQRPPQTNPEPRVIRPPSIQRPVPRRVEPVTPPRQLESVPPKQTPGQPSILRPPGTPPVVRRPAPVTPVTPPVINPPVLQKTTPPVIIPSVPPKTTQPSILRPGPGTGTGNASGNTPPPLTPPLPPKSVLVPAPEGQRVNPGTRVPGTPGGGAPRVQIVPQPLLKAPIATAPVQRFDQVQQGRKTTVEAGGRRTIIQEGGNRTIIKQDNRVFIRHDESSRFRRIRDSRTIPISGGGSQTFYIRPDGYRVISETDRNGGLIRRYRRGPDGREFNIIDNRRFWRNAGIGIGVGLIGAAIILNLRSPVIDIPRERYIVDYERVSDEDLYETLNAAPVERLDRAYSLEEVRYNYPLRERMRSVDLDAITFEFGAFEVTPDQHVKLERIARTINRVIGSNPDEVFLIEGHTDAVGEEVDNLSLSDRRAQSVAQILSEEFGVPPENMVTQGYGEQFLKVKTQGPERVNRRVTVRRVTPLIAER